MRVAARSGSVTTILRPKQVVVLTSRAFGLERGWPGAALMRVASILFSELPYKETHPPALRARHQVQRYASCRALRLGDNGPEAQARVGADHYVP